MSRKKKQRPSSPMRPTKPACLEGRWHFDPDVPTYDFFEHRDPDDHGDLGEVLDDVISSIRRGDFLRWEAIVCDELGLLLTARQEEAVGELLSFSEDPADDRILYIDEIPRPDVPWYEIVRKVASHLLMEPYRTSDPHFEVTYDGWRNLVSALEEHGDGLSLPRGVDRPIEVVPAELRHKLWLQTCLDQLSGLGQDEELTLRNEEQQDRIQWFIRDLREHKESVESLGLTLEKLLKVLVLPPRDEPIFVEMMQERLGLNSTQDRITERLS
jgi:hypothetical protein